MSQVMAYPYRHPHSLLSLTCDKSMIYSRSISWNNGDRCRDAIASKISIMIDKMKKITE